MPVLAVLMLENMGEVEEWVQMDSTSYCLSEGGSEWLRAVGQKATELCHHSPTPSVRFLEP